MKVEPAGVFALEKNFLRTVWLNYQSRVVADLILSFSVMPINLVKSSRLQCMNIKSTQLPSASDVLKQIPLVH